MAVTQKADMFSIHQLPLLAALKRDDKHLTALSEDNNSSLILIQTSFLILRTYHTERIVEKYPLDSPGAEERQTLLRQNWQRFEVKEATARLRMTNTLVECQDEVLARKLMSEDGKHAVMVDRRLLNIFGDFDKLQELILESIEFGTSPIEQSPIRISVQAGHTCGYVMVMQNVIERVY